MKKVKVNSVIALFASSILLSSCNATMHTVGTGGKGDCKTVGQYDAKKKQWYLFWGLLPLNKVDSKELAGGAENYTVRTTTSFGDGLIAIPGSYLLGLKTQTIRVSKGDK
jgi:predicted small secreted protein